MTYNNELKTVSLTMEDMSQCRVALVERITRLYGYHPLMQDSINRAFQAYLKMGGCFTLTEILWGTSRY